MLLFPAALLIMVALAAITVDSAIAFMAQRELVNATAAAANDAATEALSDTAFYRGDRIELSPSAVESVAVDRVFQLVNTARHSRPHGHRPGVAAGGRRLLVDGAGARFLTGRRAVREGHARLERSGGGPRRVDGLAPAGRWGMLK